MPANLTPEESAKVSRFVHAFSDLTKHLGAASDVRYTAPPRSYAAKGIGKDPTGDTVLDLDRANLSSAIDNTLRHLSAMSVTMEDLTNNLAANLRPYTD